jgi:hypothetical protein
MWNSWKQSKEPKKRFLSAGLTSAILAKVQGQNQALHHLHVAAVEVKDFKQLDRVLL